MTEVNKHRLVAALLAVGWTVFMGAMLVWATGCGSAESESNEPELPPNSVQCSIEVSEENLNDCTEAFGTPLESEWTPLVCVHSPTNDWLDYYDCRNYGYVEVAPNVYRFAFCCEDTPPS